MKLFYGNINIFPISRILCWTESSKEQHLFGIEIFCNIINAYCILFIFYQFNASMLNKSIIIIFYLTESKPLTGSVHLNLHIFWLRYFDIFVHLKMTKEP